MGAVVDLQERQQRGHNRPSAGRVRFPWSCKNKAGTDEFPSLPPPPPPSLLVLPALPLLSSPLPSSSLSSPSPSLSAGAASPPSLPPRVTASPLPPWGSPAPPLDSAAGGDGRSGGAAAEAATQTPTRGGLRGSALQEGRREGSEQDQLRISAAEDAVETARRGEGEGKGGGEIRGEKRLREGICGGLGGTDDEEGRGVMRGRGRLMRGSAWHGRRGSWALEEALTGPGGSRTHRMSSTWNCGFPRKLIRRYCPTPVFGGDVDRLGAA